MIRSLSGDKENWENNVNPNRMLLKSEQVDCTTRRPSLVDFDLP